MIEKDIKPHKRKQFIDFLVKDSLLLPDGSKLKRDDIKPDSCNDNVPSHCIGC